MFASLSRSITFQAAHRLPKVPEGHKCRRLHGHSYTVRIWCRGPVGDDGFVLDNAHIDEVLMVVRSQLDHQCLNEIELPFSENPTGELIGIWILKLAQSSSPCGPFVSKVEIHEGDDSIFCLEVS